MTILIFYKLKKQCGSLNLEIERKHYKFPFLSLQVAPLFNLSIPDIR
jgi:hypothetical protein